MNMIEIKNLNKRFDGVRAVDNLSIKITKGVIAGIVGPNGSGKTTLINLLTGSIPSDSGAITINGGKSIKKIKPHKIYCLGITRTFQEIRLFNQMTALDNILVALTKRNPFSALIEKNQNAQFDKARDILKLAGLWEKRDELAVNLSYGQRKLMEIARALAAEAEIFLFDEPFAGLFPGVVNTVVSILKKLKEDNKTIVMVEHNMEIIRELCDWVIVMESGRALAQGRPEEVFQNIKVIDAYLGG